MGIEEIRPDLHAHIGEPQIEILPLLGHDRGSRPIMVQTGSGYDVTRKNSGDVREPEDVLPLSVCHLGKAIARRQVHADSIGVVTRRTWLRNGVAVGVPGALGAHAPRTLGWRLENVRQRR